MSETLPYLQKNHGTFVTDTEEAFMFNRIRLMQKSTTNILLLVNLVD